MGNDQIFWIGGKYQEESGSCTNDEKFVWDYSDRLVFETIADGGLTIGLSSSSDHQCCLGIYKDYSRLNHYRSCQTQQKFLCQRPNSQTPHCNLCQPDHIWYNSTCQPLSQTTSTNLPTTPEQQFWQSKTTCRCSNNQNQEKLVKHGFDCLNENCHYVYDLEEVKKVYEDVYSLEVTDEVVDRFVGTINNGGHKDTDSLDSIDGCVNLHKCMQYFTAHRTFDTDPTYGQLITGGPAIKDRYRISDLGLINVKIRGQIQNVVFVCI